MKILPNFIKRRNGKSRGRALILLYHRITEIDHDPWSLCVKPNNFRRHLEVLNNNFEVIKLSELLEYINSCEIPNNSVVITFDDGYRDNIEIAEFMLEEYGLPFTIFITTGNVDKGNEFWWDALEKAILHKKTHAELLELNIYKKHYKWRFPNQSDEIDSHLLKIYYEVWKILQSLSIEDRNSVLKDIIDWSGHDEKARETHSTFNSDDIRLLGNSKLVEIGAHTVNHPKLAALSRNEQLKEIIESKEYLENLLGQSVDYFSYPFGGMGDYNSVSTEIVKEKGFLCAYNNLEGVVTPDGDIYNLPRIYVNDVDSSLFHAQINSLFKDSK